MCGELAQLARGTVIVAGSSPRVRGTRQLRADAARVGCRSRRFIPACAGNSLAYRHRVGDFRGSSPRVRGTHAAERRRHRGVGSSPRVRGTPHRVRARERTRRFIPACATTKLSLTMAGSVHPRVCGELLGAALSVRASAGSSPRVRGTLRAQPGVEPGDRFIPACAGNSCSLRLTWCPVTVHPRVCGELNEQRAIAELFRRFIPACAGNSLLAQAAWCEDAVHPRVCGELMAGVTLSSSGHGSSPRVRGTPRGPRGPRGGGRFIPACAGNSSPARPPASPGTVHPRVCGELGPRRLHRPISPGSSPRVRGTRVRAAVARAEARFIPACAGNSFPEDPENPHSTVHPRVCGELPLRCASRSAGDGSSPRVRGTLPQRPHPVLLARFIPACAGNSPTGRLRRAGRPVHPRVCGELYPPNPAGLPAGGSSPRVRGTPSAKHQRPDKRRFIPACAGNSLGEVRQAVFAPVHPRVCGELLAASEPRNPANGSSPRVRGTLFL